MVQSDLKDMRPRKSRPQMFKYKTIVPIVLFQYTAVKMSGQPLHESQNILRDFCSSRVFHFQFFIAISWFLGNSMPLLSKEIFLYNMLFLFGFCSTMEQMNWLETGADLVNMKGVWCGGTVKKGSSGVRNPDAALVPAGLW